jgi:putative FmdB family regulatory protein
MPIYEYRCVEDGDLIELIRPMADADTPVDDPKGKGRLFERVLSTFAVSGSPVTKPVHQHSGGGCGCGNPHGPCGR